MFGSQIKQEYTPPNQAIMLQGQRNPMAWRLQISTGISAGTMRFGMVISLQN